MVDEHSDSRATDGGHSPDVQFQVRRARWSDAAMLARYLQTSQQLISRLKASTQADLERLLARPDGGVLLAAGPAGVAGALGYRLDAGTLQLFSFTLSAEEEGRAATRLLRAAEDLAQDLGAVVMAAQVDKHGGLFALFLDAGFSIDDEELETNSGGGVIRVAGVIKLVGPASP